MAAETHGSVDERILREYDINTAGGSVIDAKNPSYSFTDDQSLLLALASFLEEKTDEGSKVELVSRKDFEAFYCRYKEENHSQRTPAALMHRVEKLLNKLDSGRDQKKYGLTSNQIALLASCQHRKREQERGYLTAAANAKMRKMNQEEKKLRREEKKKEKKEMKRKKREAEAVGM